MACDLLENEYPITSKYYLKQTMMASGGNMIYIPVRNNMEILWNRNI